VILFFGALTAVLLLVSPMCHLHYYCLTMPLVAALLHRQWSASDRLLPGASRTLLLGAHVVGVVAPLIFHDHRNLGFAPAATLPLWAVAVGELYRATPRAASVIPPARRRRAA
jgi:hypothetical protein